MDLSPVAALLVGLLTVVSTGSSGCVAVEIGSVLPSTDAQRTYGGYEVATPSRWALVTYVVAAALLVALAAIAGVLVFLFSDTSIGSPLFAVAAGVVAVILLSSDTPASASLSVGSVRPRTAGVDPREPRHQDVGDGHAGVDGDGDGRTAGTQSDRGGSSRL